MLAAKKAAAAALAKLHLDLAPSYSAHSVLPVSAVSATERRFALGSFSFVYLVEGSMTVFQLLCFLLQS